MDEVKRQFNAIGFLQSFLRESNIVAHLDKYAELSIIYLRSEELREKIRVGLFELKLRLRLKLFELSRLLLFFILLFSRGKFDEYLIHVVLAAKALVRPIVDTRELEDASLVQHIKTRSLDLVPLK